jgi:hypothetical protein
MAGFRVPSPPALRQPLIPTLALSDQIALMVRPAPPLTVPETLLDLGSLFPGGSPFPAGPTPAQGRGDPHAGDPDRSNPQVRGGAELATDATQALRWTRQRGVSSDAICSIARPASAQRVREGPPAASPRLGRLSSNVFERVGVKVGELHPP